jgi:RNA-splicing ligase RtcB
MPDVHAGKGCTIGLTMTIKDKIVPGMVGVDIGCGMETVEIAETALDLPALDDAIRKNIPVAWDVRKEYHKLSDEIDLTELRSANQLQLENARHSIGTLGGGNHFIEVDWASDGRLFLIVHSIRHRSCFLS